MPVKQHKDQIEAITRDVITSTTDRVLGQSDVVYHRVYVLLSYLHAVTVVPRL